MFLMFELRYLVWKEMYICARMYIFICVYSRHRHHSIQIYTHLHVCVHILHKRYLHVYADTYMYVFMSTGKQENNLYVECKVHDIN